MNKSLLAILLVALAFLLPIESRADITGDLEAGMPLSQVIRNGLLADLTIEDIVAGCINAGADCNSVTKEAIAARSALAYRIVYAAVKAKPDRVADILRAALSIPGVRPASCITAAATACPSALEDIRTVALDARVPEAILLAALAAATGQAPAGPGVFGGTWQATGSTGGIGGTGGTGGYGGGGGGVPASPSR